MTNSPNVTLRSSCLPSSLPLIIITSIHLSFLSHIFHFSHISFPYPFLSFLLVSPLLTLLPSFLFSFLLHLFTLHFPFPLIHFLSSLSCMSICFCPLPASSPLYIWLYTSFRSAFFLFPSSFSHSLPLIFNLIQFPFIVFLFSV